jgi:hypothetical protein
VRNPYSCILSEYHRQANYNSHNAAVSVKDFNRTVFNDFALRLSSEYKSLWTNLLMPILESRLPIMVVRYEDLLDVSLRADLLERVGNFINRDPDGSCLNAVSETFPQMGQAFGKRSHFYNFSDPVERRRHLECAFNIADTRRTHRASTDSEALLPKNRKVDAKLAFDQDPELVQKMWADFKSYAEYFSYSLNTRHH